MSDSESEDDNINPRTVLPPKRRRVKKLLSSDGSEESNAESQDQSFLKPKRTPATKNRKYDKLSSDDQTPIKASVNIKKTPATRSSERLRVRNSREFRLPSRDKRLEEVSPGNIHCPRSAEKKIKDLRPRRLVNNFIRERNSYVADKVGDIYSTDSSLSDFINDSDDDDDDESSNSSSDASSKESSNKGCSSSNSRRVSLKKRKKTISSDSDKDSDDINPSRKARKMKGKSLQTKKNNVEFSKTKKPKAKSRRNKVINSDELESSESMSDDENVPLSTLKSTKKKNIIPSDSDADKESDVQGDNSDSDEDDKSFSKLKGPPQRRRSTRYMTLVQKRQDLNDKKYKELLKKRNKGKLVAKDCELKENNQETTGNIEELHKESDDGIEILKDLIENCNESDESDKDFVVSDDVSEDEIISDQDLDIKFVKLLNDYSQTALDNDEGTLNSPTSGFSVQSRRKGRKIISSSKWRRINTRVESDDSDDSGSKVKEEYDHNCELHAAVNHNDIDSVKKILQQNPNSIYDVGYRRRSVLHLAALNGNADMVQLLFKMKANCELLDKYEFPPIVYAINGHSECLKVFLRHAYIKQINKELIQTPSKMSLLHFAVGETRTGEECTERGKCLELLFAHDKTVCMKMLQHRDARRRTPLEAAVYASQHQCVAILLKHGANPLSFRTKEGGNLLHFAVECASHLKHTSESDKDTSLCLRQLVDPLAMQLNEPDTNGFTPLMYACETGNDECALALIQAGANILTKDSHGTSPLHLAAMAGSTECVNLLLSNGHPVDCVDNCGWPPLLYANFKAQEECVLALMNPKPEQLFVLGKLLKKQKNEEEKKKTLKVVKNVLFSLANHDAYYTVFNDFIRVNPVLLDEYNHGILQHTWRAILDFDNKQKWFRRKLNILRNNSYNSPSPYLKTKRSDVLGSTMQQIGHLHGSTLRGNIGVTFEDEPGICTGPKREFFACLSKDVVDPKRSLFDMSDDSQFSPIPNAYFSKYTRESSILTPNQNKTQRDTENKKEEDYVQIIDTDCTDSELLAADNSEENYPNENYEDFITDERLQCTDSELVTALETAIDSGFCSSTTSQIQQGRTCTPSGSSTLSLSGEVTSNVDETIGTEMADGNTDASALCDSQDLPNTDADAQEEQSLASALSNSQEISTTDEDGQGEETSLPAEAGLPDDTSSSRQSNNNTWIPCLGKNSNDLVIQSIALRSKMKQLRLIGRLVGSAICQDMLLSLQLSKHFVKQVLGIPLSHPKDLSSFDHELHQNMVIWVQENSVDNLDLPFGIDAKNPWTGQLVSVNFSDDEEKTVDDSNKHEYIKLVSQYKLQTFIEKEVEEFSNGLNEVIPRDLLSFFTADEFSLLLNGVTTIDVDDWKNNTRYRGFTESDQIITWFWDIVSRLKEEEKALLLKFSTGSPCVPIGGFANLQGYSGPNLFTITKICELNKIPLASTCFNMLKLTDYDSEKQLREKLLIAIRHGSEGFSFS